MIGHEPTRVFESLRIVHRRDGRATVRTVAEHAGLSVTRTFVCLGQLRREDLVAWSPGQKGTLRPLFGKVR